MMKESYIEKNLQELQLLCKNLQDAFNTFSGKPMKLTAYKDSANYEKLINAIEKTTGIKISKATLRDLITLKHKGKFRYTTFVAIDKFIATYTKTPLSWNKKEATEPIKQKVFWAVNQGYKAGIFINSFNGAFLDWSTLKEELESKVITQCPRIIPVGSKVELQNFYGKKDWIVCIIESKGNAIGSVWLGGNPMKQWYQDGLVRVGTTHGDSNWTVYQVFQRYSDGSYRLLKSYV